MSIHALFSAPGASVQMVHEFSYENARNNLSCLFFRPLCFVWRCAVGVETGCPIFELHPKYPVEPLGAQSRATSNGSSPHHTKSVDRIKLSTFERFRSGFGYNPGALGRFERRFLAYHAVHIVRFRLVGSHKGIDSSAAVR